MKADRSAFPNIFFRLHDYPRSRPAVPGRVPRESLTGLRRRFNMEVSVFVLVCVVCLWRGNFWFSEERGDRKKLLVKILYILLKDYTFSTFYTGLLISTDTTLQAEVEPARYATPSRKKPWVCGWNVLPSLHWACTEKF